MKTNMIFYFLGMLCLCLSMPAQASFSGGEDDEEEKPRFTRYIYLKAVDQNIEGKSYLYTEVIEVKAYTESGLQFQIHSHMMEFEDLLYKLYPKANMLASMEWLGGSFEERNIAKLERDYAIQQHGDRAVKIALQGSIAAN